MLKYLVAYKTKNERVLIFEYQIFHGSSNKADLGL